MFKVRELKFHDIYLSVPYQGQQINCVLTTGIKDGSGLYVIVPGLFGDRTDSRHMFTRLSQAMAEKGYSVLRFDYIGGGSTQGDYSKNDFDLMLSTLSHVVRIGKSLRNIVVGMLRSCRIKGIHDLPQSILGAIH